MPTYDYQCPKCKHLFEEILSIARMNEPTTEPCPKCQAEGVEKVMINAPSIGDPVALGVIRPDPRVRERLETIKKNYPNSKINV